MNLRSPLHKLLLALSVLAVLSAQLFGIGRGFLCDCSGRLVAAASDHCHGPHDAHCHEKGEPAHSSESCPDDGDTKPHSRNVQDFQSAPAPAVESVLTEPVLWVVLTLENSARAKAAPVFILENAVNLRGSPPFGVAVARTVVLLI